MLHDSPNQTRIVAKIIRELLSERRWESLAELTPELSDRCRRLNLHIDADIVNAAYTLISSNTPLVQELKAGHGAPVEQQVEAIPRSEASGLLDRIQERCGLSLQMRTMKPARVQLNPRIADKQKAMDIVLAELEQAVREEPSA